MFFQQILKNVILNFLLFYLISFENKECFIEEAKFSNILNDNE
jgi:hypothetical protein